ncbi:MAG TPA: LCP family protein [Streptosporangiaceae bacterium]|jgi:LCP family protein required for cell wall assembly|nr:LCP family protein [Streptosporangiaceae bacterium]
MSHGASRRDSGDFDPRRYRRSEAAGGRSGTRSAPRGSAGGRPAPRGPAGRPPPPGGRRGVGRARDRWRRQRWQAKAGYILASLVAVVAVAAGLGGFAVYRQLDGNITKVNVGDLSGRATYGVQNILVLGSQTRLGQRGNFGYDATPGVSNSDNLLLIHLDPSHTHAIVLSIPRDTFVYQPACQERPYVGTGVWPAQQYPPGAIIDGALNIGGATCAVQTVEALTGIKLDHFVEFNFNSFRTMVGQLGGVEVCVPPGPGYHDTATNLNLSPGKHLLDYGQALQYVRDRHGVGDGADAGGDLPRIELQQAFISSVVQKVNSTGLLTDIPSLLGIADTATRALTVDQGLGSTTSLLRLAESMAHLKSRNVTLITMPSTMDTFDYPTYDEHLMTVQPQDDVLFQMIRTDQAWQGGLPTQPNASVQVHVLNATGQPGLAAKTRASLRQLGFDVVSVGDAPYSSTTTVDYAGEAQADSAYTLMTALHTFPAGQNTLAEPASQIGTPGPVTLILGADFAGVNPPPTPSPAKSGKPGSISATAGQTNPGGLQTRNAAASICSGLPPANPGGG